VIFLARVIGGSGSTDYLRNQLRKVKLDGLDTFKNIKFFKDNFPRILQEKENEEKAKLTSEIDTLKYDANSLSLKMQDSITFHKKELIIEKENIFAQVNDFVESHKRLVNLRTTGARRKLKRLETKFDLVAEKPFKKDKKQIKKIEKSYHSLEKTYDKTIGKKLEPLHKADGMIKANISFLIGATGEEIVIKELSKLPDTYYIFNEYKMRLGKSVYSKNTHDYVRSCRIDHLVVGPTGIFIIETKNWSAERLRTTNFLPHRQVTNAGLVFYIFLSRKFRRRKFPNYKIVVMLGNVPKIKYPYVTQLSLHELNSYIIGRQEHLTLEDINKIVKWL